MNKNILFITIIILLQSCSTDPDEIESYFGFDIPKTVLDTYLQEQMETLEIPGMSIAFLNEGEIVHYRTMGYANLQEQIPVTEKTIFEAASMSKPVFAYFVMKYVEEGKLDLDTTLYTYWPYPDIAHDERYKKINSENGAKP